MNPCLFYRPNRRHLEAEALAIDGARYRDSKFFEGVDDVEWLSAKINGPRVPYPVVYVLKSDPLAEEIAECYRTAGSEVRLVDGGSVVKKQAAVEPEEVPAEWTMQMAPDVYLKRFPNGPKAALARKVLNG
jgi:hypothetical protein